MTNAAPDVQALISEARRVAALKEQPDCTVLLEHLADALENTEAARKVEFEIATRWHDIAMKLQGVRP